MLGLKYIHVSKWGPRSIENYNAIRYNYIFYIIYRFYMIGRILLKRDHFAQYFIFHGYVEVCQTDITIYHRP